MATGEITKETNVAVTWLEAEQVAPTREIEEIISHFLSLVLFPHLLLSRFCFLSLYAFARLPFLMLLALSRDSRFSCNLHTLLALCLSWVNIPEHSSSSSSGPHGSSSSGSLFITLLMASCWAIVRLSLLTELMACTWGACIALYWSAEKDWGEDNVMS